MTVIDVANSPEDEESGKESEQMLREDTASTPKSQQTSKGDGNQMVNHALNSTVIHRQINQLHIHTPLEQSPQTEENIDDENSSLQDEYFCEAAPFISDSYIRSQNIDAKCEGYLKRTRERLNLSSQETDSIDNQILVVFQIFYQNLSSDYLKFRKDIAPLFEFSPNIDNEKRKEIISSQNAIKLDKEVVGYTFSMLGYEALESENIEKARNLFEEAIKINSNDASAYIGVSMVLKEQGNFEGARNFLIEAKVLYENQGLSSCAKELNEAIKSMERKSNFFKKLSRLLLSN